MKGEPGIDGEPGRPGFDGLAGDKGFPVSGILLQNFYY